jgi:hypothetical protein
MQIATISFVDRDSGDEAEAIVRVAGATTGLCLSLKTNGDIEVHLAADELDKLIGALQKARELASAARD